MQHNPDPAIVAAAVVTRQSYTYAHNIIASYNTANYPLPGTIDHDITVAWRAACHALNYHGSHSGQGAGAVGNAASCGGGRYNAD